MKKLLLTLLMALLAIPSVWALDTDSISKNKADLDSLIQMIETNYAGFPIIMEKGYGNDYQTMKSDIKMQVSAGQMGIQQAVCEYCYWFFSRFDGHVYVDNPLFMNTYFPKCHIRYAELFEYAPKPVSCKVNDKTWLIRVPSCNGQNPTFQWLEEAVQQYLQSGCSNLIIDIRGNTGGSDAIWEPVGPLLFDHQPASPEYTLFRNTPKNLSFYQRILKENPDDDVAQALVDNCSKSQDEMVQIEDEEEEDEELSVSSLPKKAAIVIDKSTASSAESLVRFAKMYCDTTRTKVYGKENTWGAQYSGNIIGTPLPNSQIWVYYPTCISSLFLQGDSNGSAGLSPDVRIYLPYPQKLTDNCDEWILWIADQL
ncbi:MAG: peptidase S41 [Prevotella sp.]|nr:peptidase S41 [Prevotella sp.]